MTRWHDITKREPAEKDLAASNRRGQGILIVCTRDGSVGEWECRMSPMGDIYGGRWEYAWMVPVDWCGDSVITHWRHLPRPPGEWFRKLAWRWTRLRNFGFSTDWRRR